VQDGKQLSFDCSEQEMHMFFCTRPDDLPISIHADLLVPRIYPLALLLLLLLLLDHLLGVVLTWENLEVRHRNLSVFSMTMDSWSHGIAGLPSLILDNL